MACLIVILALLNSLGQLLHSDAAPTYVHNRCSTTGNFTLNSLYHSNLNLLFSSLSSNATMLKKVGGGKLFWCKETEYNRENRRV
ncbi:hypothetical protein TIFTF001_015355 [Ficus carica]|uniref:Secreted protein n=1 Tax=Ficus carica TaxID=3494 RepID=A0AA87ZYG8_FICCA|nr:hypothetical protein TIFTF001_015355 [Ficus carica]